MSAGSPEVVRGATTTGRPVSHRRRVGVAWGARAVARPELVGVLVLAAVLNLWVLDRNGFANAYYAAAVRSMSSSWHAFLYGSLDLSGLQTVDKPPLALWIQALSVRAFGFNSWSLLVPQALMGVASVGLTYDLVRRRFGRPAGFAGALVLALTPITVAISRHNNPDALLILCCVAALWATVRGLEDGRARWLMIVGACVGLGFETKMAIALLVVPGIAAAWLWVAPRGRRRACLQLGAAGAVAAAVSLAWPVMVWLTPAADRPWISGTSDNSIWSLILNYNGLGRVTGQQGTGGGGSIFGGNTGVLRLLNSSLGGQAGWLLGAAVLAAVALIVLTRLRRHDHRTGWLITVGGAFAVTALVFSSAKGIFHPYYVSLLAPFSAALVGAGVGLALDPRRLARGLGAAVLSGGAITELVVLRTSATGLGWMPAVLICGVSVGVIVLGVTRSTLRQSIAVAAVTALLLIAPGSWAVETLGHATSGTFPTGGPASAGIAGGGMPGMTGSRQGGGSVTGHPTGMGARGGSVPSRQRSPGHSSSSTPVAGPSTSHTAGASGTSAFGGSSQSLSAAISYVEKHDGGTLVVSSQSSASTAILASDASVAGIGGFSGNETQISTAWLAHQVAAGKIRYVLVDSGSSGISDGRIGSTQVMALVKKVGTKTSVSGLYDLRGKASALTAARP